VIARQTERELIFDVEGMTCASCVAHIEQALKQQDGVVQARVSLASRTAAVRCTTSDADRLVAAMAAAGYTATPHGTMASPADETKPLVRRLAVSAFLSFDVIVFSLVAAPGSRSSLLAAWLLATPVQFYGGWPFLRGAYRAARTRAYTMDTLIACGSLAAYGYSMAAALRGGHHAYFDTAAMIITLILLGRVLEAKARSKAGDAARTLLGRQPRTARRIGTNGEQTVDVDELAAGDRVVVLPGETIPSDGTVVAGRSSVDLSMLTGESTPLDVEVGSEVVGGSLNGEGRIQVSLTRVGDQTRLAGIVRLLEITQASKAPIQRLADRIAAVFVPRVIALALGAGFVLWYIAAHSAGDALMRAAAVLLVACPCSLGLATPIAIMTGSGRAAELGILFKGGEVFEVARRVDTVLIDKTGTLTDGAMSVQAVLGVDIPEDEVLALAAAVESGSEHPIARSVIRAADERGLDVPASSDHRAEPGAAITGIVGGHRVRVGRPRNLPAVLAERSRALASAGQTVFAVWRDDDLVGLIGAADSVRPSAADLVRRLRRWGIDVALVSGDQRPTVEAAARAAGIERAVAEVFPEGKVEEVKRLQAQGRRVAFVGDGINDAPALAQADLGIAIGTGTDVAKEAGHVLILGSDLGSVDRCLELARKTFWVIAQNLTWAFAYNLLMIPLAAAGRVSPLTAAGAMAGSSVTVVVNALRLRRYGRAEPDTNSFVEPAAEPAGDSRGEAPLVPSALITETAAPIPAISTEPVPLPRFVKEESSRLLDFLTGLWARSWEY
jgi:heavy metal translocating P-type ATPase